MWCRIASLLSSVIHSNNAVSYEYDRNIMVCKFISEDFYDPLRWQLPSVSIHITLSTTVTVSGIICFPKKTNLFVKNTKLLEKERPIVWKLQVKTSSETLSTWTSWLLERQVFHILTSSPTKVDPLILLFRSRRVHLGQLLCKLPLLWQPPQGNQF